MPPESATATPEADQSSEQQQPDGAAQDQAPRPDVAAAKPPVSPDPSPGTGGDEQASAEGNGADAEALRTMARELGVDATVIATLLDALPDEEREKVPHLQEARRSGEQKGLTQVREAEDAVKDRDELFAELVTAGATAKANLGYRVTEYERLMKRADRLREDDDADEAEKVAKQARGLLQGDAVKGEMRALEAGVIASLGRVQSQALAGLRDRHKDLVGKGQLSDEEEERLRKARYEDARAGTLKEYEVLLDIVAGKAAEKVRQDELPQAEKRGAEKSADHKKAAELLVHLQELRGNTAPLVKGGRAPSKGDELKALQEEIQALDPSTMPRDEFEKRWRELKARADTLKE